LKEFVAKTHDNRRVLNRNDTRHGVNNPLRTDDDSRLEKLVLKMLNGSEIVQELDSLSNLRI